MNIQIVSNENMAFDVFRAMENVRVVHPYDPASAPPENQKIFIASSVSKLDEISRVVHWANNSRRLCAFFVYCDVKENLVAQLFSHAGLHLIKRVFLHRDWETPLRVVSAWDRRAESQTIADAAAIGESLFVAACDAESYFIPFSAFSFFREMSALERADFTISEDGSFIHWPSGDIHLDLDSFRYAVDPEYRQKVEREKKLRGMDFCEAIVALRNLNGLRQKDIAGLSERHVRRIEQGQSPLTIAAAEHLARAHGMDTASYLDRLAAEVESRRERAKS